MAEGLAKVILGSEYEIQSAGSSPGSKVNPYAVRVLAEKSIDISHQHPKAWHRLPTSFLTKVDFLITLCAEEMCPVIDVKGEKLHWGFPDPAEVIGSEEYKLSRFREIRDAITQQLETFKSKTEAKDGSNTSR